MIGHDLRGQPIVERHANQPAGPVAQAVAVEGGACASELDSLDGVPIAPKPATWEERCDALEPPDAPGLLDTLGPLDVLVSPEAPAGAAAAVRVLTCVRLVKRAERASRRASLVRVAAQSLC